MIKIIYLIIKGIELFFFFFLCMCSKYIFYILLYIYYIFVFKYAKVHNLFEIAKYLLLNIIKTNIFNEIIYKTE